jgi:hypothetical protein
MYWWNNDFTKWLITKMTKNVQLTKWLVDKKHRWLIDEWKGINCKQSTRWQHLSQSKASVFFSLQKKFSCYETQQLILGTGTAIWWVTEPHSFKKWLTKWHIYKMISWQNDVETKWLVDMNIWQKWLVGKMTS